MGLTSAQIRTFEKFLKRDPLLAFDFDGTLAPIVQKRTQARMRSSTRALLKQVSRHFDIAIVTGRGVRDARTKTRGVRGLIFIGNHGAEIGPRVLVSPSKAREWRRLLSRRLREVQGADIEDKKFSLSIHFIQSRDKGRAERAIREALKELRGCKVVEGKYVFNRVDARAPGKGGALKILMRERKIGHAIFFGDDVTDEDAFRLSRKKVLSVKIGARDRTRAQLVLKRQIDIDAVLKLIVKRSTRV
ncbi:MAG: trehalose-phosphatase [Bdellovibrionia bacterium]